MGFWRTFKTVAKSTAISVPIAVTFMDCIGYPATVEGYSMQPALNPNPKEHGDVVFLFRWAIFSKDVKPGDVVAFISPRDPDQRFIKRVIAMPEEFVSTRNMKNNIVRIPKGHCWLEGDNEKQSFDSNHFGPVALGLLVAKATHIIWPPHRWGKLECIPQPDRASKFLRPLKTRFDIEENEQDISDSVVWTMRDTLDDF